MVDNKEKQWTATGPSMFEATARRIGFHPMSHPLALERIRCCDCHSALGCLDFQKTCSDAWQKAAVVAYLLPHDEHWLRCPMR